MNSEPAKGTSVDKTDLFRNWVEHNTDCIYLIQDRRIIYSNTKVERLTGYTSDELSCQIYTRFLD